VPARSPLPLADALAHTPKNGAQGSAVTSV
jgi:hypothetical protein